MPKRVASWANLDFEAELASPSHYKPAAISVSLCQRWSHILRLLPKSRQSCCLDPLKPECSQPFEQLVVWGVTPRSIALARRLGAAGFPALEVVRQINDKRYSHQLEVELGIALPYSQIIESTPQLVQEANRCPFDWVLKHPFGYSGRERIFGKANHLSESALGWARRKLGEGWTLLFEPWVERQHDFSMHFQIARDCQVEYLGWCSMVSDPSGGYRGNFVNREQAIDPRALDCGRQVAARLAEQGYWGPLGIDALAGNLGAQYVLRPLVEINARYSFGRHTLALSDWLPKDWSYLWWHPSKAESGVLAPAPGATPLDPKTEREHKLPLSEAPRAAPWALAALPLPSEIRPGIYQLPLDADPGQGSGTAVIAAPSYLEVERIHQSLLAPSRDVAPGSGMGRHD